MIGELERTTKTYLASLGTEREDAARLGWALALDALLSCCGQAVAAVVGGEGIEQALRGLLGSSGF